MSLYYTRFTTQINRSAILRHEERSLPTLGFGSARVVMLTGENIPASAIADYGLIGNCRTAALVSTRGSVDWLCLPNFDSPSVFAAILDTERGGCFQIAPVRASRGRQRYLDDTNVLETVFETSEGEARLIDCFPVREEADQGLELWPDQELLRVVEGVRGRLEFAVLFAPRPLYGDRTARLYERGRLGIACAYGRHLLLLNAQAEANLRVSPGGCEGRASFTVGAGERIAFSLTYTEEAPAVAAPVGELALRRLDRTCSFWRGWMRQCRYDGLYREQVRRSALTLKLLTFAPSGAIVAAPTTSLPESIGGARNWDYRYCWLRDASFTTQALVSLGFLEEAKAFSGWTLHATNLTRPRLKVLYSVYGKPSPKERSLDWLPGYRGSRPVRVGNAADRQFQLDVYGETLEGIFQLLPFLERVDSATRRSIIERTEEVCRVYAQPDEGIWEVRSGRAHHTHSKALAWTALDGTARVCRRFGWSAPVERFETAANRLRAEIEERGFNAELGSYVRVFDGAELDASLLTLPLFGYCEASSRRMVGTRQAVCRRLSRKGLLYRYRLDETDDGLRGGDGAFAVCSFWLAENFARAGRPEEARRWFEAVLSRANALGLWPEEIDPDTGEFLGNYPQAFSHVGLINAASAISDAAGAKR